MVLTYVKMYIVVALLVMLLFFNDDRKMFAKDNKLSSVPIGELIQSFWLSSIWIVVLVAVGIPATLRAIRKMLLVDLNEL